MVNFSSFIYLGKLVRIVQRLEIRTVHEGKEVLDAKGRSGKEGVEVEDVGKVLQGRGTHINLLFSLVLVE